MGFLLGFELDRFAGFRMLVFSIAAEAGLVGYPSGSHLN
jgi:hypothetical protein